MSVTYYVVSAFRAEFPQQGRIPLIVDGRYYVKAERGTRTRSGCAVRIPGQEERFHSNPLLADQSLIPHTTVLYIVVLVEDGPCLRRGPRGGVWVGSAGFCGRPIGRRLRRGVGSLSRLLA
jgi:hypothetical protein